MTKTFWWLPMLALAGTFGVAQPAFAGFNSAYTDINLDQCLVLDADDFGASWACPGYKGYPLRVSEGDLRFVLNYGFNIQKEPGFGQSLGPFNHLGPKLEWRLSNASGGWLPVATIVRYFTQNQETYEETNEVLVVTQLLEGQTCHIAYIDALANPNANELARQAADKAGKFDCANDKVDIIGKFTAWDAAD
ncbi:MAG: hypothetical protein JWP26_3943 [Devosia sp.]|uniref:hypothetical protein n=1 Tax=Devosia sp. TaxID=1871048 RepID=UPI00262337BF|nr:hypothetical protein [Devosia sp.]MDB5588973.1 hypothetical protein [Devosia sp.]